MAKARVFRGNPEQKQVALYDNFFGGINTTDIDSKVKTNEFRQLQNVELAEEGRIQKRKGWKNYSVINRDLFDHNYLGGTIDRIYYFNVFKDETGIFNKLRTGNENYSIEVEMIYVGSGYLIYGIYRVTKTQEIDPDTGKIKDSVLDVIKEVELFDQSVYSDYLPTKINEIEVMNYGGRRYVLLNQIIKDSQEILEFYQTETGEHKVNILKKDSSFTPNAYDAKLVGFNIFKNNPLEISSTTAGQTAILNTYIVEYGGEIGKDPLYTNIFESGKFTLAVVYSGSKSFIENLKLRFFEKTAYGNKYLDAEIGKVRTDESSSWAYYDVELLSKPEPGQVITLEFTELEDEEIVPVNDDPYESYEALFNAYYNKELDGSSEKRKVLIQRVSTDTYNIMEASPDSPFEYRKLMWSNTSGTTPSTPLASPVYLHHDIEYNYFRNEAAKGIIYGDFGSYSNEEQLTYSINTNKLRLGKLYDIAVVDASDKFISSDLTEIKNLDQEKVGELEYDIIWTSAYPYFHRSAVIDEEPSELVMVIENTVTMLPSQDLSDFGIRNTGSYWSKEEDYAYNYVRPRLESYYNTMEIPAGYKYIVTKTTFKRLKEPGQFEDLGTFKSYLTGQTILKGDNNYDVRNAYKNYNDYVLTQDKLFKVYDGGDIKIVRYNGNNDQVTSETNYKDYFTDITGDYVTYEYFNDLTVRNGEPIIINSIDFKTMKGIIINDRMVLYTGNTIIWSDVFSTRRDESNNVEQSFTYFPNNNWVTLPLSYNDSIQRISYFRGSWIIFTKESIFRLSNAFDEESMEVVMINDSIGCIAPGSIRGINNVLIFLSEDGLYALRQNYYQEGLENVVKIDTYIKGIIPYGDNYESTIYDEQYLLHVKDKDGSYVKTVKQYYNMVNNSREMPYTVDLYREQPNTVFKHLGNLYGFRNNELYVYGEGYTDFMPRNAYPDEINDYAYRMIIETPEWDLEHPLHEKKYKNIYMKFTTTKEVQLEFTLIFDKNIAITNENFIVEMNEFGELEFVRYFEPNLIIKTVGSMELDSGRLGAAFLGLAGYQVYKIDPGSKGRVMKIKLENNTADSVAIDAISVVYKLGKMRESV